MPSSTAEEKEQTTTTETHDHHIGRTKAIFVAMRWKMLGAFAGAFSVVFIFIAIFVIASAVDRAENRLLTQMKDTAVGGATTVNGDAFEQLLTTVPAVPDPNNPTGFGYPTSQLFDDIAFDLFVIYQIVPEANPYTYYLDPIDDKLYFAVSAGYYLDPPFGVTYKQPVESVVTPQTYALMLAGLQQTVEGPAYTDSFGSWISSFTPIFNTAGESVGAMGVDFSTQYVKDVRKVSIQNVLPALLISYATLLLMVLYLSSALVRPLRRLINATKRIEDGEYDLEVSSLVKSRFPDEMFTLGESFERMAAKVAMREKRLTRQVQRLQVEIDQAKKEKSVKEITETDFFADLASKATELRRRMREPEAESPAEDDSTARKPKASDLAASDLQGPKPSQRPAAKEASRDSHNLDPQPNPSDNGAAADGHDPKDNT